MKKINKVNNKLYTVIINVLFLVSFSTIISGFIKEDKLRLKVVQDKSFNKPLNRSNKVNNSKWINKIKISKKLPFRRELKEPMLLSYLHETDYGKRLTGTQDMWWCGSAHKIWQKRSLPSSDQKSAFASIRLARNEYEAIQVVVKPKKDIKNVTVKCSDLLGLNDKIMSSNITIDRVGYVYIKNPSDSTGIVDNWPDPLPPLKKPISIKADINQPFWITVYAPKKVQAGVYKGTLHFSGDGWQRDIPLQVTVWDFTLSDQPHIKSALGLPAEPISQYQRISGKDLITVMHKYYANFEKHRVSPYNPIYGSEIHVDWGLDIEKGRNGEAHVTPQQVKVDFTDFDKAMEKAVNDYHITTFKLDLQGVGNGQWKIYTAGKIGPYTQGSSAYNILFGSYLKQLQDHLLRKGWLDKAYLYWADEPIEEIYDLLIQMAGIIRQHAPKLKWMLTEQIGKELSNSVDIWCPVLSLYDHKDAVEQQQQGHEVWWYICTGPKAPYIGEFIDHAAIEPRLWLWQAWKNKVQGILIWSTNYWTTSAAYPHSLQNPWQDPQSWEIGHPGKMYGNGDGRFLYPPNHHPNKGKHAIMDGPVNSMRWELLRDGIEDYEYFWILQQEVNKLSKEEKLSTMQKTWLTTAANLLQVPLSISTSLTDFSKDPTSLMKHRDQIALAIMAVDKLSK